ncbi:hypothetical protein CVT25_003543 [Psilocybe cyanescens]|uniref:Uncharacterized protein n=1 Tax=Psilocybe cyanescens TaxID=93625 RepID=A0A409X6Q7_PSICY|nr:hypothetical protein CVT25_003543 [Psilocybe cyanescens]
MLSRVAKRVRRQSLTQPVEPWTEIVAECVQDAPDLLRWSDIPDTPFPRVAMGGYARFYANSTLQFPLSPSFCPILSQCPEGSPSKQVPSTSPLFPPPSKQQRLTVIHEASRETVASTSHTRNMSTSTSKSPKSLRRRRRQLLRTPSIERDFAVHAQHLFASNTSVNEMSSLESPTSPGSAHSHSHSHSSSDSHSSQSESHHSEEPTTPTTSVEGGDDSESFPLESPLQDNWEDKDSLSKRPESGSSFSTAKSDFDEV